MQHFTFLNWWIGQFFVSFFDVTNRLIIIYRKKFLTHIDHNFSINNEGENLLVTGTEIIVVSWIWNKYLVHNGDQILYEVAFVKLWQKNLSYQLNVSSIILIWFIRNENRCRFYFTSLFSTYKDQWISKAFFLETPLPKKRTKY